MRIYKLLIYLLTQLPIATIRHSEPFGFQACTYITQLAHT